MAFSFGTPAVNTNQATSSPSFSFGAATQQARNIPANQSNSSFPAQNAFSFGNANTNQQQNSTPAKPAFSFGGTANTNTNANLSLGSNTTVGQSTTNMFGQSNPSNNLFGQPMQTQSTNSGLFGQQNQNGTANTGLFGQQNQSCAATNTGLFGQQNQPGTTNTGLFGQQNQSSTPSNGLFGQSAGSASNNIFGQSNNNNNINNNNLFGSTTGQNNGSFGQANAQPIQTNNLFGSTLGAQNGNQNFQTINPTSFGQVNQNTQIGLQGQMQQSQTTQPTMAQSIYGQTLSRPQFSWSRPSQNLNQSSMPSFAMPSNSLSQSKFNPSQTYNADAGAVMKTQSTYGPSQPAAIQDQLLRLKNAWDPTHPDCMFQAYFYNRVAPETASLYTKPDDHKQKDWDDAVAARPDNSVVPVLGRGFVDLQARAKGQEQQIHAYRTRIHEIADKLKELNDRHMLHSSPKIENARRRHVELSRRALALAAKVQVIKCRGYALRPEEEQMKNKITTLDEKLRDPNTFGRVDELWAKMTLIKSRQQATEEEIKARGYYSAIDFDQGDGLDHIQHILQEHNTGLKYVSTIIRTDLDKIGEEIARYQNAQGNLDKSRSRQ